MSYTKHSFTFIAMAALAATLPVAQGQSTSSAKSTGSASQVQWSELCRYAGGRWRSRRKMAT